ncbi:MAG TPA: S1/P1 nuclease [Polyangiaceae bacterium]|nr:S1/P1 nuclease [Polyangiaceae bacterium]
MKRFLDWSCALAVAASLGLAARPSAAWNQSGHMQIAAAAYDQLPALVQQRLVALLHEHPRFAEDFQAHLPADVQTDAERARWFFLWAAVWPDELRREPDYERRSWHYVDFPLYLRQGALVSCGAARAAFPEEQRRLAEKHKAEPRNTHRAHDPGTSDDPGASLTPSSGIDEIRPALAWARRVLADRAASAPQRALALSWLLHLVGDAHQPLHAVSLFTEQHFASGDRGGNDILVHSHGPLHHAWDDALGEDSSLAFVNREARSLRENPELAQLGRAAAHQLDIESWLDEDCALARSSVYTRPILASVSAADGTPPTNKPHVELDPSYFQAAHAAARRRAAQASFRLAALLQQLFAGQSSKLPDTSR